MKIYKGFDKNLVCTPPYSTPFQAVRRNLAGKYSNSNMNTDHFFIQGKTHNICEDYALSGQCSSVFGIYIGYAILSDGCSSEKNTDIGVRILCKKLEMEVCNFPEIYQNTTKCLKKIIQKSNQIIQQLELSPNCLSATLGYIIKSEQKCLVQLIGDGAIAIRYHDSQQWIIHLIENLYSAPYYLRYELSPKLKKDYLYGPMNKFKTTIYHNFDIDFVQEHPINPDIAPIFGFQSLNNEIDMAVIMSDGVNSFHKMVIDKNSKQFIKIPPIYIIKELLNFKHYKGEFVKRRCKKALKNWGQDNIVHFDDLSVIALNL